MHSNGTLPLDVPLDVLLDALLDTLLTHCLMHCLTCRLTLGVVMSSVKACRENSINSYEHTCNYVEVVK